MILLKDKDTGRQIGSITEDQLQFLADQLEEESEEDRDYYINRETIEMFEEQGADKELVALLRKALGAREDMEIEWTR